MKNNIYPDAEYIISLFGGNLEENGNVENLMQELNTIRRPTISPDDYDEEEDDDGIHYLDWVLIRKKGIELGFSEHYYHKTSDFILWGEGDLLLTQAYFYSEDSEQRISKFQGSLPFGLQFSDSREQARERLLRFENTRHSNLSDTWDVTEYRLNIQYKDNKVNRISCIQLPEPITTSTKKKPTTIDNIISAFGMSPKEVSFSTLWKENGKFDDEELEIINEERHLDLKSSLGVTLNFTGTMGNTALFKSITFHRNREFDSCGWKGELPFSLSFEDDPITIKNKINPEPVKGSDSIETGYFLWHFSDYSMHILYDNIDNRLLRVTLMSKGTWASISD